MILDASGFTSGSQKAVQAAGRISAAAKNAGLSVEQFALKQVEAARAARAAGALNEESARVLEKVEKRFASFRKEARSLGQTGGVTPFGTIFETADKQLGKVIQKSKELGVNLRQLGASSAFKSPLGFLITDSQRLSKETQNLKAVYSNLFDNGVVSAARMTDIMRGLGRVFTSNIATTQGMRFALLDARRAMQNLNKEAPSGTLSKGIATATQLIKELKGNTALTGAQFDRLREALGPIANEILGINVASKDFAGNLSTIKGRDAFAKQLRDVIKLEGQVSKTGRAIRQSFFGNVAEFKSFRNEIKRLGDESSKLQFAQQLKGLDQVIRKMPQFRDAVTGVGGSLDTLKTRQAILNGFLQQFGSLADTAAKPTGRLRVAMEKLARQMGVAVGKGFTFADFIRAVETKAKAGERALNGMSAAAERSAKAMRGSAHAMSNFNDLINVAIGKLIRYRIAFFLMSQAIFGLRSAIETFKEVQSSLADIEKVIVPVAGQIDRLKTVAFDFAIEFGESVGNVLNIMKVFAQQGKTFAEIVDLTRTTLIAAAGAGLTTEQSVEALTAISKAYRIEAGNLIGVVDKLANVQANFAVTAPDLADALKLIAVTGRDVGISLDELLGQVTAIATITRKSGQAIAQSLKTIFARFERTTTINQFKSLGIAIQDTDGSINSLSGVLDQLNEQWDTLSDAQRFNIAQTVAGVRRYTDFLVLMDNYGEALEATKASLEAQGTAQRNTAIELGTFARQIQSVQSTLQQAFESVASSGLVQAIGGLLEVSRVFASLIANTPGLAKLISSITQFTGALIAAKVATITYNFVRAQSIKLYGDVFGASQKLLRITSSLSTAEASAAAQQALNTKNLKLRSVLTNAVVAGDSRRFLAVSRLILAQAVANGELTKEQRNLIVAELRTKAYTLAKQGATTANLGFAASIRSGVGAAAAAFGPTGWVVLAITLLSFIGTKFLSAKNAMDSFGQSTVENARRAQGLLDVERKIISDIERQIRQSLRLKAAYQAETKDRRELVKIKSAEQGINEDLIRREPRLAAAIDEVTGSLKSEAEAFAALDSRKLELDTLENNLNSLSETTIDAARRTNRGVNDILAQLARIQTAKDFKIAGKVDLTQAIEGAGQDRNVLEKIGLDAAFLKQRLSTDLGGTIVDFFTGELADQLEALRTGGEAGATTYVKTFADTLRHNLDEVKPALKALEGELGTLNQPFSDLLASGDVNAFEKTLLREIEAADGDAEKLKQILEGLQTPAQAMASALIAVRQSARDVIAEFLHLAIVRQSGEKTGFILNDLTNIIDDTVISARNATNSFEAFDRTMKGTALTGFDISQNFHKVGVAFNSIQAGAEKARETLDSYNTVQQRLERLASQPEKLNAELVLAEISDISSKFKVQSEGASDAVKDFVTGAGVDFDTFKKNLNELKKAGNEEFGDLIDILTPKKGGEVNLSQLANSLLQSQKAMELLGEDGGDALETIRALQEKINEEVDKSAPRLKALVKAWEKQKRDIDLANKSLDHQFGLIDLQLSKWLEIRAANSFLNKDNADILEIQIAAMRNQTRAQAEINFKQKEGIGILEDISTKARDVQERWEETKALNEVFINQQEERLRKEFEFKNTVEDITRAIAERNKQLVRERAILKTNLELSLDFFNSRAESLGATGLDKELLSIQARKRELEAEKKVLEEALKVKKRINEGDVEAVFNVSDLSDLTGIYVDDLQAAADRTNVVRLNQDQLLESIQDTNDELRTLSVREVVAGVQQEVERSNKTIQQQKAIFSDILDINKEITDQIVQRTGGNAARAESVIAKARLFLLKSQFEEQKKQLAADDERIRNAVELAKTLKAQGKSVSEITQSLEQVGIKNKDEALEIVERSSDTLKTEQELLKQSAEVIFKEAVADLEELNRILDVSVNRMQSMAELSNDFIENSRTFVAIHGQGAVKILERELLIEKLRQTQAQKTLEAARARVNAEAGGLEALQEAAHAGNESAKLLLASYVAAVQASNDINVNLEEIATNLSVARAQADPLFKKLLRDSELFNSKVEGAAGAIADFFSALPETVTRRFDEIKDIEEELAGVQAEIVKTEAGAQLSGNFREAENALRGLRQQEQDLRDDLERAKSLTRALKEEFVALAGSVSQAVLEVETELLKDQLRDIFADIFGGAERRRLQELDSVIRDSFLSASEAIRSATERGVIDGWNFISSGGGAAIGPTNLQSSTGLPSLGTGRLTDDQIASNLNLPLTLSPKERQAQIDASRAQLEASTRLKQAATSMLKFAAIGLGTAAGGGGTFAGLGSQAGALVGAGVNAGPKILGGISAGGLFASLAFPIIGGILGGLLDPKSKKPSTDLEDSLDDNTDAVQLNTQALQDLRSQLINAPARFVVPSGASIGGFVGNNPPLGGDSAGESFAAPSVQIVVQGNLDASGAAAVQEAVVEGVTRAYKEAQRRFGRRVAR